MSESYKYGVKLFTTDQRDLGEFIPIFHGWIQQQALPGHLLIDVHDYSHVHHGPGILLVAHEANMSIDEAEGRRGLLYIRKQPTSLSETIHAAQSVAKLLGFDTGTFEVFVNDRLQATTAEVIGGVTGGKVSLKKTDPRERQTFVVHSL